jgi:hypothetical protein
MAGAPTPSGVAAAEATGGQVEQAGGHQQDGQGDVGHVTASEPPPPFHDDTP